MDEGYIKYHCQWDNKPCISPEEIKVINHWREKLFASGLIGMLPNGIGFGNISIRQEKNTLLISGSATGGIAKPDETHYSRVLGFNLEKNELSCEGLTIASSESLTHAALYAIDSAIQSVVHVHHHEGWLKGLHRLPCTRADIVYGTPEMAAAVQSCYYHHKHTSNLIFMAGHEDGIISFGNSIEEAVMAIISFIES